MLLIPVCNFVSSLTCDRLINYRWLSKTISSQILVKVFVVITVNQKTKVVLIFTCSDVFIPKLILRLLWQKNLFQLDYNISQLFILFWMIKLALKRLINFFNLFSAFLFMNITSDVSLHFTNGFGDHWELFLWT